MSLDFENIENFSEEQYSLSADEKCLMERFREGDTGAFEELYNLYADKLYKYGQSLTSDLTIVEDSLQDFFVKFWNSRSRIDIKYSILFYLIKSFRREVISKLKNLKGKQILLSHYLKEIENDVVADDSNEFDTLQKAIKELPARQYEFVMLKYVYGHSIYRIAEILEITIESAYNLSTRTLLSLRKILN